MKLSVIIPVYNVEKYLIRCLDSVIASVDATTQYCEAEIICIDDGSTDDSSHILLEYATRDSRFKLITQKNMGLSMARNAGLDVATGDWISFVDSDDWIEEGYFSALLEAVSRTGFKIAAVETKDSDAVSYWCKKGSSPAVAWGKIYSAELSNLLRFPEGRLHEDEFTVHKAVFAAGGIAGVKRALYHYTVRADSIMGTKSEKNLRDWLDGCSEQAEFLKKVSEKAYSVALAKKIQVDHWIGKVNKDDVAEYARVMRWRVGRYFWPEHYRHPWFINKFTWQIIKRCCFL